MGPTSFSIMSSGSPSSSSSVRVSGKIPSTSEMSLRSPESSVPYQSTVNSSSSSCWVGLNLPTPESVSDSSSSSELTFNEVEDILEEVIGGSSSKLAKICKVFCPMYNV